MKFQGDLIFASIAVLDVGQWYLKRVGTGDLKIENAAIKVGCSPIPSLDTQLPIQHVLLVSFSEELGQALTVLK